MKRPIRWFSSDGEFAVLAVGGAANGIVAIGGVARGIVAIGGVLSVGVVSIGLNSLGSWVAVGLNAVGPISISGINGIGVATLAGVNGCGAYSHAGVNSTGVAGQGGVNTTHSVVPAALLIVALFIASLVVRGERGRRMTFGVGLSRFLRGPREAEPRDVRARLRRQGGPDGELELRDGGARVWAEPAGEYVSAQARALEQEPDALVLATLVRVEEAVPLDDGVGAGYRARPPVREIVRCLRIQPIEPQTWLPTSADEVQWFISWSARLAAVVSAAAIAWLTLR